MNDGTIEIYFLAIWRKPHDYTNLRIKIGKSADALKRVGQHRRPKNGREPECHRVLAVLRGSGSDESCLHREFDELRWVSKGLGREREVFRPDERLTGYIRWLRDQHYTWVPADEDPYHIELSEAQAVPFSEWCPAPGRWKPPPGHGLLPAPDGPLNMPPREISKDDYYTAESIIRAATEALGGHIDLDPASHVAANKTVKAEVFFTKADNGLDMEWRGKVWLNPPFSAWQKWAEKALLELESGRIEALCALSANRTVSAKYFGPFLRAARACCQTEGRIPFEGLGTKSPDDGHTIFYFGPDRERFREAFNAIGKVWFAPEGE